MMIIECYLANRTYFIMAAKVSHESTALPLATPEVVWQVTRKFNSFSRGGRNNVSVDFTAEPNNVTNIARHKYSGLGQSRTVGVEIRRGKKKGEFLTLNKADSHTPAKATARTPLRLNNKRSYAVTRSKLATHRPDLEHVTLVRVARIANSERRVLKAAKIAAAKKE
jgi:hypothetical protein